MMYARSEDVVILVLVSSVIVYCEFGW